MGPTTLVQARLVYFKIHEQVLKYALSQAILFNKDKANVGNRILVLPFDATDFSKFSLLPFVTKLEAHHHRDKSLQYVLDAADCRNTMSRYYSRVFSTLVGPVGPRFFYGKGFDIKAHGDMTALIIEGMFRTENISTIKDTRKHFAEMQEHHMKSLAVPTSQHESKVLSLGPTSGSNLLSGHLRAWRKILTD
jgi:hypothetical protein